MEVGEKGMKAAIELRNGFKDPKRLADIHDLPCVVCSEFGLKQKTKTIAHHRIGKGLGKKASDLLTIALCESHHNTSPDGIHNMPLHAWEEKFLSQDQGIRLTDLFIENINN